MQKPILQKLIKNKRQQLLDPECGFRKRSDVLFAYVFRKDL